MEVHSRTWKARRCTSTRSELLGTSILLLGRAALHVKLSKRSNTPKSLGKHINSHRHVKLKQPLYGSPGYTPIWYRIHIHTKTLRGISKNTQKKQIGSTQSGRRRHAHAGVASKPSLFRSSLSLSDHSPAVESRKVGLRSASSSSSSPRLGSPSLVVAPSWSCLCP